MGEAACCTNHYSERKYEGLQLLADYRNSTSETTPVPRLVLLENAAFPGFPNSATFPNLRDCRTLPAYLNQSNATRKASHFDVCTRGSPI